MQSAEAIIFFFLQKKLSNVKYKIYGKKYNCLTNRSQT